MRAPGFHSWWRCLAAMPVAVLALMLLHPGAGTAQEGPVRITVGTIAPEGTPWYDILQDMLERWKAVSGGRITWSIMGAEAGDEASMVTQMRLKGGRGINMAGLSTIGLENVAPECAALSIPLLFKSYDELDYVRSKIQKRLEQAIESKGDFVVLNWADAGFVRIFTTRPARTVADVKQMAIFTSTGSPQTVDVYNQAGFRARQIPVGDILMALKTNKVQAIPAPPIFALGNQWFGAAPNMIDIKVGVLPGATIIRRDLWEKFDPRLREALMKEAQVADQRLKVEVRKFEDQCIETMKKHKLNVITLTPQAEKEWEESAKSLYSKVRGSIVQARDFDEVMGLVNEYRAKKGK